MKTKTNQTMKTNHSLVKWATFLGLLSTLNPQISTAFAQGTAFSVQGQIQNNGAPANGLFDIQVTVHDAAGNPLAWTNGFSNVQVTNGVFMVTPDFGTDIFTGAVRS